MIELFYIKPTVFNPQKIISGVTGKNLDLFPPKGLSFSNADIFSDKEIEYNKQHFAEILGISPDKMKYQQQTHSDVIREITSSSDYAASDGMYTAEKGVVLNIKIADCTAILLYDHAKEVVMGLHSGWRGTHKNIAAKGISIMASKFQSSPDDISAYLSPAACGKCYEVGREFADYFPRSVSPLKNGKFLFDNRAEIRLQLIDAGLRPENIEIAPECSIEDSRLHSYRRDGNVSGRMSAFIGMRPD